MSDDDLEEMRRLRTTASFQRVDNGRSEIRSDLQKLRAEAESQPIKAQLDVDDLPPVRSRTADDDEEAPAWTQRSAAPKIAFKPLSARPPPAAPAVSEPTAVDGDAEAMKALGFASFGAKKAVVQSAAQKNIEFKRQPVPIKNDQPTMVPSTQSPATASAASVSEAVKTTNVQSVVDRTKASSADDSDDDNFGPKIPTNMSKPAEPVPIDMQKAFHNPFNLPISHEAVLSGHNRSVSAIALDPSGSRLLTGGSDYDVKFWDFAGMDASFRSFRQITPHDGYPVEQISYSITGDMFLVATGEHCAKLFDRDGHTLGEYIKGDKYIMDLKNTKGHCAALSDIHFNPIDRQYFISSSLDGSVRIWDVENFKSQSTVIKIKSLKKRCQVTCCAYAPDASFILAGTNEGTVQLYDTRGGKYLWADKQTQAHSTETTISSLLMASNGQTVVSRGLDSSLRVWDLRKFKEPVKVFNDLPCLCAQSDMAFSPDEQLILTGTTLTERVSLPSAAGYEAASSAGEPERRKVKTHELHSRGQLVFIDRTNLEVVQHLAVAQASVNRVLWHPKLNQIFASSGDGKVHALYDPDLSTKGIIISAGKARKKKAVDDFIEQTANIAPTVAPIYKEKTKGMIWREERNLSKPEEPSKSGPGKRAASSHASFHEYLTQHMLRQNVHEEDPRAAVLKYAEAAKNPMFFRSYTETQPEALKEFDQEYLEEENAKNAAVIKAQHQEEDEAPVYKKFKSAAGLAPPQ